MCTITNFIPYRALVRVVLVLALVRLPGVAVALSDRAPLRRDDLVVDALPLDMQRGHLQGLDPRRWTGTCRMGDGEALPSLEYLFFRRTGMGVLDNLWFSRLSGLRRAARARSVCFRGRECGDGVRPRATVLLLLGCFSL